MRRMKARERLELHRERDLSSRRVIELRVASRVHRGAISEVDIGSQRRITKDSHGPCGRRDLPPSTLEVYEEKTSGPPPFGRNPNAVVAR